MCGNLNIYLGTKTSGVANEYLVEFITSADVRTSLGLPTEVNWGESGHIDIEQGYRYQISILNNIALGTRVEVNFTSTDPA